MFLAYGLGGFLSSHSLLTIMLAWLPHDWNFTFSIDQSSVYYTSIKHSQSLSTILRICPSFPSRPNIKDLMEKPKKLCYWNFTFSIIIKMWTYLIGDQTNLICKIIPLLFFYLKNIHFEQEYSFFLFFIKIIFSFKNTRK